MFSVRNLTKKFGGVTAVNDVSFSVTQNTIMGVIGPNGSGKTTTLNCINGVYPPSSGEIVFKGEEIQGLPPHEIAELGVGRTFQIPKIFKRMTILENLMAPVLNSHLSDAELKARAGRRLERIGMTGWENNYGEELSGGQQKLLDLAQVLMFSPDMLLLDEPFAGVHPTLKEVFFDIILELKNEGKTFLLVSHDLTSLYTLCDEIIVLDLGELIAQGPPREIETNERVITAYVGR